MRVAIYARVSTKDQSPEIQIQELKQYAALKKYEVHDIYVDKVTGKVGKRTKHARYDDLLREAAEKKFDVVLVWKFDRFARSLSHLTQAMALFEKYGVAFISYTQNIDTTVPVGKLFFHILASIAEFEHSLIAERTRAGLRLVKETGLNSKGVKVTLGRPERVAPQKKAEILELYRNGDTLWSISKSVIMPLPSVYSIVKRNMVKCLHGKYRCTTCRSIPSRIPLGASPRTAS